jgi:hypothetical protein
MPKRCILCKCNLNKYVNIFNGTKNKYKLFDYCDHNIVLFNKNVCIKCTINIIRYTNQLENINNKELRSMSCIKWKTGESNELCCWQDKVPICDVLDCDYPAVKKYVKLENFINNAKYNFYSVIYIPTDILNIIFGYAYRIHPIKNGLCINHNEEYNMSVENIFYSIPECKLCVNKMINKSEFEILRELRHHNNYFCGNVTLHHKSSIYLCCQILLIDGKTYNHGGCLELCKQLNTLCDICKMCIGHTPVENDIYTHNIFKYPHCQICNKHSKYPHCKICNTHSEHDYC